jgi:hypothetical protein
MNLFTAIVISIIGVFNEGDKPELAISLIPSELLVGAHTVVRESKTLYIITSPKVYAEVVRETVTILKSNSPYRKLYVHYNKYSKAKILAANIYDHNGKLLRKIKKDQISDRSAFDGFSLYSDNRFLFIDMDYPKLPYTVEYEYEVMNSETMSYPDWIPQSFGVAVQSASLVVRSGADSNVLTKVLNSINIHYTEKLDAQTWSLQNAVAINHEVNGPSLYFACPLVLVSPVEFQVENYKGSMRDWNAFGKFIYEINVQDKILSEELSQQLDELLASASIPDEQIDLL